MFECPVPFSSLRLIYFLAFYIYDTVFLFLSPVVLICSFAFVCTELSSSLILAYTHSAYSYGYKLSCSSLGDATVLCGKILLSGVKGSVVGARSVRVFFFLS